ncbi:hypothetical protein PR003_g4776 [Phytophthora rubi]|uniref:HAT C-terminal dimerisation domain-containing protein n=1 Tax=Phytophthora rubi TaxID=129364 RepID=A0A6A4FLB0_9STRA|nr:hypothetical protein PR003_g4776 [Phytophthora rubi]
MKKLRTLKEGSKPRLKTPIRPVLRQATRWGSTHAILRRYFDLLVFLSVDNDDLAEYLPSPATHRRLEGPLDDLSDCEYVSLALQGDNLDLLAARDLLDGLIAVKPSLGTCLGQHCALALFEAGCYNVLAGDAAKLTRGEKAVLQPFLHVVGPEGSAEQQPTRKEGFAERILKKRKVTPSLATYPLVRAIPPTSNVVERLFSVARVMIGHERQALTPAAVEMLLFLKTNAAYWGVEVVD